MDVHVTWEWSSLGSSDQPGPNGVNGFRMCDAIHWTLKKQGVQPGALLVAIGDQNVANFEYNKIKTLLDEFLHDDTLPAKRPLTFRNASSGSSSAAVAAAGHGQSSSNGPSADAMKQQLQHHHRLAESPQKSYTEDVRNSGNKSAQSNKSAFADNSNNNKNNNGAAHDDQKTDQQQPPHYRDRNERSNGSNQNNNNNDSSLWFQNGGGGGDRGGRSGERGGYGGDHRYNSYGDRGGRGGRGGRSRGDYGGPGDRGGGGRGRGRGRGGGYGHNNNYGSGDARSNQGDNRSSHDDARSNHGNDARRRGRGGGGYNSYSGGGGGGGGERYAHGHGYNGGGGGRSNSYQQRDDGDAHSVNSWSANYDKGHLNANKSSPQNYDLTNIAASNANANANSNTAAVESNGKNDQVLQQIVQALELPTKPSYQVGDIVWYHATASSPILGIVKFVNAPRNKLVVRPLARTEMQEVEVSLDTICSNGNTAEIVPQLGRMMQELATTNQCRVFGNYQRELFQNALVRFNGDVFGTITTKNANDTFEVQIRDECSPWNAQKMHRGLARSQLEIADEAVLRCVVQLKQPQQQRSNIDENVVDGGDGGDNDDADDDDDVVDGACTIFSSSNADEMRVYHFLDEVGDDYIGSFLANGGTKLSFVLDCDEALLAEIGVKPMHRRYILRKIDAFDAQQFETVYAEKCAQRETDKRDKEEQARLQLQQLQIEKEKERAQEAQQQKLKQQEQDRGTRSFNEYPSSSHDEADDDGVVDAGVVDAGLAAKGGADDEPQQQEETGYEQDVDDTDLEATHAQQQQPQNEDQTQTKSVRYSLFDDPAAVTETGYEDDVDDEEQQNEQPQEKGNGVEHTQNENGNEENDDLTDSNMFEAAEQEEEKAATLDDSNMFEAEATGQEEEKAATLEDLLQGAVDKEPKPDVNGNTKMNSNRLLGDDDSSSLKSQDLMQKRKVDQNETRSNHEDTSSTSPSVLSADEPTLEAPPDQKAAADVPVEQQQEARSSFSLIEKPTDTNENDNISASASAAPASPKKTPKKKFAPKLFVFDFDETVTSKHLYHALQAMADSSENSAEDHLRKLQAMSDDELMDIFGGVARVEMLQKHLKWFSERGVKLAIISYGFTEPTKAALKRMQLYDCFDDACVFGNDSEQLIAAQHDSSTCIQQQFVTQYTKDKIVFFDDNDDHIRIAKERDVCSTFPIKSDSGVTLDDFEKTRDHFTWKEMTE